MRIFPSMKLGAVIAGMLGLMSISAARASDEVCTPILCVPPAMEQIVSAGSCPSCGGADANYFAAIECIATAPGSMYCEGYPREVLPGAFRYDWRVRVGPVVRPVRGVYRGGSQMAFDCEPGTRVTVTTEVSRGSRHATATLMLICGQGTL